MKMANLAASEKRLLTFNMQITLDQIEKENFIMFKYVSNVIRQKKHTAQNSPKKGIACLECANNNHAWRADCKPRVNRRNA